MGRPLGCPERPWGELLARQGLLQEDERNLIALSEGVLAISRALPPRFGRGLGGPEGEKVIFLMIFGRVKSCMNTRKMCFPLQPQHCLATRDPQGTPRDAQGAPQGTPKGVPNGSKGSQGVPKGAKGGPKGAQRIPRGSQEGSKGYPKGATG